MYKLTVMISGRYGEILAEAIAPLDGFLAEGFQPLKLSDQGYALFDTAPAVVQRVKQSRQECAKILEPQIRKVILDVLASKDLLNGYTKEEQAAFNREFLER